ncbi:hypothetical protein BGW36DRAFT_407450 [Talaromyces proteolyticus]|uniref:BHLH domain-containing protein n=1 Tax=Talaromyces proteolyticus TaxID=1131652 RepID=A0AAD4KR32_9EURO|nr:uncharacterized protein BGW36DRAFT_407450 [Talaromyces proteolyticus]KAH8697429.1 hypothetical protein BGW36DRAFT_407450 [Talaromyces proteolyticus]
MPPRLPPTPATSGELHIKDHTIESMAEHSFALPPAALSPVVTDEGSSSRKGSVVFQPPVSPASPDLVALGSRRMSAASSQKGTKRGSAALDEFNLPPPPTRTRKIIQMKPKTTFSTSSTPSTPAGTSNNTPTQSSQKSAGRSASIAKTTAPAAANPVLPAPASTQQQSGSKKKQPSATSAAGRKIARKTAHSLIERRRRSKMNEEFSTLKDMIPACRGQEMHKLAILQASIDYMNYLEECITELKSASGKNSQSKTPLMMAAPPGPPSPTSPEVMMPDKTVDEESFSSSSAASPAASSISPAFSPHTNPHQAPAIDNTYYSILPSPALGPLRSPQQLPPSTHTWRPSQPITSTTPSPAILPQQHHRHSISSSYASSTTSGAAHEADSMIDHEASAALLMLNMDRRGTGASIEESAQRSSLAVEASRKLGMSVRDLLAP